MHPKHKNKLGPKDLQAIAAVAYSEAGRRERRRVRRLIQTSPEARRLLEEMQATARAVRSIEPDACPESVLRRLRVHTQSRPESFPWWKYATTAAACALIILIALNMRKTQPMPPQISEENAPRPAYTEVEIEAAEAQILYAFFLVNRSIEQTSQALTQEALPEIGRPLIRGVRALQSFLTNNQKTSL